METGTQTPIPDRDLVCFLIEMVTEDGPEPEIWRNSLSLRQQLEVRYHVWVCRTCRTHYPQYLERQLNLQERVTEQREQEEQCSGQLEPSLARDLRGLLIKIWPSSVGATAVDKSDSDFVAQVWQAYLRHIHRRV